MIIKKFQGKTEAEAIELAKKELGEGVVVMNVKNVKPKGLFAFLKKSLVEVTVALEEESERYSVVKKDAQVQSGSTVKNAQITEAWRKESTGIYEKNAGSMGTIEEKLDSLQTLLVQQLNKMNRNRRKKKNPLISRLLPRKSRKRRTLKL